MKKWDPFGNHLDLTDGETKGKARRAKGTIKSGGELNDRKKTKRPLGGLRKTGEQSNHLKRGDV